MTTFICAAEVWQPYDLKLRLSASWRKQSVANGSPADSSKSVFGESLANAARSSGAIIIDNVQLDEKALDTHIDASAYLAIPVLAGDFVSSVLVLALRSVENKSAAAEVWYNPLSTSSELKIQHSCYSYLERFEFISQRLVLMRGRGLPGIAWERMDVHCIDNLSDVSGGFLRASKAREAGLTSGVAIPFESLDLGPQILTFLSSAEMPVAKQVEIWKRSEKKPKGFRCVHGYSIYDLDLKNVYRGLEVVRNTESTLPIFPSLYSGQAAIVEELNELRKILTESDERASEVKVAVALPQLLNGKIKAVMVMLF